MPHAASLIATIATGLGLALAGGFLAARVGLPPLVGYLIAGIVLGPATPGLVADVELTQEFAEVGVILMMFGVGLHVSIDDLIAVRRVAVPGALARLVIASALGALPALAWGWTPGAALTFGLALSVSSTVVLVRAFEGRRELGSVAGRIATGWLVVEDLVTVLVLVLLPALAAAPASGTARLSALGVGAAVAVTLLKVGGFVALVLVVGTRVFPRALWAIASAGSRELFTLAVITTATGVALVAAELFSVSFALGAFFAGTMMRESELSHRAAQESLPFRDAFSVLFFVSVGMLFDPTILVREPLHVLAVLAVVVVGKTIVAAALVLAFGHTRETALKVAAGLAQIGEFSFILAGLGVSLGLLPRPAQSLVLAGALLSISLNPLVLGAVPALERWSGARRLAEPSATAEDDPLAQLPSSVAPETVTGHVVLVGYGRVGRRVGEILDRTSVRYVVADENRETVAALRERGFHAVSGDAAEPAVLIQAHVARARVLVVAIPDLIKARQMVQIARTLNPDIHVLLRTHSDEETELLERENLGAVFMGERELGAAMARHVLERVPSATAWPARRPG